MSDAPDGPPEVSGGKKAGDPGMEDATETGGSGAGHPATGESGDDSSSRELPGEKGGAAAGGGA